jgi:hypothetical protein
MKDRRRPLTEHFLLSQGYEEGIAPPRAAITRRRGRPAQVNIAADPPETTVGKPQSNREKQGKYDRLNHKKLIIATAYLTFVRNFH